MNSSISGYPVLDQRVELGNGLDANKEDLNRLAKEAICVVRFGTHQRLRRCTVTKLSIRSTFGHGKKYCATLEHEKVH